MEPLPVEIQMEVVHNEPIVISDSDDDEDLEEIEDLNPRKDKKIKIK